MKPAAIASIAICLAASLAPGIGNSALIEVPRQDASTEVWVASGPIGEVASFWFQMDCRRHAGDPGPHMVVVSAIAWSDGSPVIGRMYTDSMMPGTQGSSGVAGITVDDEQRSVTYWDDRGWIGMGASSTAVGFPWKGEGTLTIAVAAFGGGFRDCHLMLDETFDTEGDEIVIAADKSADATAGYAELGGADRNAAWLNASGYGVGVGSSVHVETSTGTVLYSCEGLTTAEDHSNINIVTWRDGLPTSTGWCPWPGQVRQGIDAIDVFGETVSKRFTPYLSWLDLGDFVPAG